MPRMSHEISRAGMVYGCLVLLGAATALGQPPATQPVAPPSATQPFTPPAPVGENAAEAPVSVEVDQILTRLEARTVNDLRAKLRWAKKQILGGDEEIREGRIWYRTADPVAQFAIHFDSLIVAERRDKCDEKHAFDGQWYIESKPAARTITRRQVRRASDTRNPFKLGQGPFPVPFGQKKDDILREFIVTLAPADKSDPPNTDHLRLMPRPGTVLEENFKELEFWVHREGPTAGLPIRVRMLKRDGTGRLNSVLTVDFKDAELNTGLAAAEFTLPTPPGFKEEIEALPEQIAPPPMP